MGCTILVLIKEYLLPIVYNWDTCLVVKDKAGIC